MVGRSQMSAKLLGELQRGATLATVSWPVSGWQPAYTGPDFFVYRGDPFASAPTTSSATEASAATAALGSMSATRTTTSAEHR